MLGTRVADVQETSSLLMMACRAFQGFPYGGGVRNPPSAKTHAPQWDAPPPPPPILKN